MTEDEKTTLAALEQLLDLTDPSDWPLVHMTVRGDVEAGTCGRDFEAAYKALVDRKLAEQADGG
jgi:hypothetical protein